MLKLNVFILWSSKFGIPYRFSWNDKVFLRWQFHLWEMRERNTYNTPNITVSVWNNIPNPPPPTTHTYSHTHALRKTHILLLLCLSQVWNSLEKYDTWNSHTLGILFLHSLALCKSGQPSSLSSCWAADGLRVSGKVKPELLPVRTLQSFFILLLWAGNCEEALCKLGTELQGRVSVNNTSLLHWNRLWIDMLSKIKDVIFFFFFSMMLLLR